MDVDPSVPLVFVDALDAPVLDDADHHHLTRVLRLRPGAALVASDGAGGLVPCRFDAAASAALVVEGARVQLERPSPQCSVAFALTKGDKPELVCQKLTEVGVDRIVPFSAARSVARWDGERGERHVERLRRVVREAAMQCRRVWLPEVSALASFDEVVALDGAALADPAGTPIALRHTTIVVGPEGGFTDDERAAARERVVLGPHVLRAETAAIVAGSTIVALRAGLLRPAEA